LKKVTEEGKEEKISRFWDSPLLIRKENPVISKPPLGQWQMLNGYALGYYDVPRKLLYKSSLGAST